MRLGKNPLKNVTTKLALPSISVGVLSCIPLTDGYFEQTFDVLKLCLASIRANAGNYSYQLIVVDNGSLPPVRQYLLEEAQAGRIDTLVLNTTNIGKGNAIFQVFGAAYGDYIFYTDGDVFFRPGWMQAHLEIMEAFPKAGFVGGIPHRLISNKYTANTVVALEALSEAKIEQGHLIPEEIINEFLGSVNSDIEHYKPKLDEMLDIRVTVNGCTAYVGAGHMQYLTSRDAITGVPFQRFAEHLSRLDDSYFDRAFDEGGYLRLSTTESYVYHIGNTISEGWLRAEYERLVSKEARSLELSAYQTKSHLRFSSPFQWLLRRARIRRILGKIYNWIFKVLTEPTVPTHAKPDSK